MNKLTEKEKEIFLNWSKIFDKDQYQKKVDEYFKQKKEIENTLKK